MLLRDRCCTRRSRASSGSCAGQVPCALDTQTHAVPVDSGLVPCDDVDGEQAQEGKSRLVNKPREFDLCPLRSSKAVMQTVPEATSAMTKVRARVRVRFPMTRAGSLWEHAPSTGNCFCAKPMPRWLQREPDVAFERSPFFRSENFGEVCA